jgi:GC-rich sequence DNA-binding factor
MLSLLASQIKELQPALSLDSYTWHRSLTDYQEEAEALDHSTSSSNGQHYQSPSEDEAVVNAAVATVLLPRLRKLTSEAYDPFSSPMTSRALQVIEEISYCLEVSNPRFQVSRYAQSL